MRGATESKGKIRKKMGFEEVLLEFVYNIVLLDTANFFSFLAKTVGSYFSKQFSYSISVFLSGLSTL